MSDDDERELRTTIVRAGLALRTRQSFWETPRNLVIMAAALTGVVAALAGLAGCKFAQMPAQSIIIQLPPGYGAPGPAPGK